MKILHGIKFYGFMAGDTTIKLKSINFYSINRAMSLLKIRRGTWPTMMPHLIKAICIYSRVQQYGKWMYRYIAPDVS